MLLTRMVITGKKLLVSVKKNENFVPIFVETSHLGSVMVNAVELVGTILIYSGSPDTNVVVPETVFTLDNLFLFVKVKSVPTVVVVFVVIPPLNDVSEAILVGVPVRARYNASACACVIPDVV